MMWNNNIMRMIATRSIASAVIVMVSVAVASMPAAAKRVALVIGNSQYQNTVRLPNPENDARAMAEKLRSLGFDAMEGYDVSLQELGVLVRDFARSSRSADVSIFFYAGHGIAVDGENYIVPIDAVLEDETAVDFELYPIADITKQMSYSQGANLLFLDACRDNPLSKTLARSMGSATRSISVSGLAEMKIQDAGVGIGIAFATSPGEVAQDGAGQHSPFTASLLKHIGAPNVPITSIMNRVTGDVVEMTDSMQRPWFNQSFTGDVVLHEVSAPATLSKDSNSADPTAPPTADPGEERFMFQLARESGDAADYEIFLDMFPNSRYAAFARNAIERQVKDKPAEDARNAEPQTAALSVETETTTSVTRSIEPIGLLRLPVTPGLVAALSTDFTETRLQMDRQKRKELQARLNASGNDAGRPDGALGNRSRSAIRNWQVINGLSPTGYLNALQLELLTSQTESTYIQHLKTEPRITRVRVISKPKKDNSNSQAGNSTNRNSEQDGQNFLESVVNGLGKGFGEALGDKIFGNK